MAGCHIDVRDSCLARLLQIQFRTSISRFGGWTPRGTTRICASKKENIDSRRRRNGSTSLYARITAECKGSYRTPRQVRPFPTPFITKLANADVDDLRSFIPFVSQFQTSNFENQNNAHTHVQVISPLRLFPIRRENDRRIS